MARTRRKSDITKIKKYVMWFIHEVATPLIIIGIGWLAAYLFVRTMGI